MYKLLATDMDGTLLNDALEITPRTQAAIRKAREAGLYVVPITGRSRRGMSHYSDDLGQTGPVALYNGARIINQEDGSVIYEQPLPKADVEMLIRLAVCKGTTPCIWAEDQLYGICREGAYGQKVLGQRQEQGQGQEQGEEQGQGQGQEQGEEQGQGKLPFGSRRRAATAPGDTGDTAYPSAQVWKIEKGVSEKERRRRIEEYVRFVDIEPIILTEEDEVQRLIEKLVSKILFYEDEEKINRWLEEFKELPFVGTHYTTSWPTYMEFFNREVSKGKALARIGAYLGIPREEMIAVGDEKNDLAMIRYAGLGVAMANAVELLKDNAAIVTATNNEDGVAELIEKYLLRDK